MSENDTIPPPRRMANKPLGIEAARVMRERMPQVKRTVKNWAADITAAWRSSVAAILKAGQLLIEAKEDLEHGQFEKMIAAALPFGARTAQRLMTVAADERLSNATHGPLLPPSWRTLYELTKLSNEDFDALIADGTINSEMERATAEGFSRARMSVTAQTDVEREPPQLVRVAAISTQEAPPNDPPSLRTLTSADLHKAQLWRAVADILAALSMIEHNAKNCEVDDVAKRILDPVSEGQLPVIRAALAFISQLTAALDRLGHPPRKAVHEASAAHEAAGAEGEEDVPAFLKKGARK